MRYVTRTFLSPLAFVVLLALSACNTVGNMSHEVSGWLDPGKGRAAPASEAPVKVQQAKAQIPAQTARPAKVAILVPLTGTHAQLGRSFLDAAQLAVSDIAAANFELMPKDSGDQPDMAARAAREAIAEGAELIIGPVFSTSVVPVKQVAMSSRIPVLALSNDWNVAGDGTAILGFNPAQQIRRVVEYAQGRGLRRFAVLASSSIYGDLAVETLKNTVPAGSIVAVERYQGANEASIKAAVGNLSKQRASFQALLLPEGGQALARVTAALTEVALSARDTAILGTGLWDDENIAASQVLQGGWYAAPDPNARGAFTSRFSSTYGYRPVRLATLAYDATALAAVLARQGQSYELASLANPNGYSGLDGIFRITPQGVAERGLAILEVTPSGTRVIDPAPRRF